MSHNFCRILYSEVYKDVKKLVRKELLDQQEVRDAYAIKNCTGGYSFYGPKGFYTYVDGPCCLWSAKAEGWQMYFKEHNHEDVLGT